MGKIEGGRWLSDREMKVCVLKEKYLQVLTKSRDGGTFQSLGYSGLALWMSKSYGLSVDGMAHLFLSEINALLLPSVC